MKTISITKEVYTIEELKEEYPDTYEDLYNKWCQWPAPWVEENIESLKAICDEAGVKIKDYSLGGYRYQFSIEMPYPDDSGSTDWTEVAENWHDFMYGARALTWIENNILAPNRIPWTGPKRWKLAKYGSYYRPGMVKPCPWTGYFADEHYIDALIKHVKKGYSLHEAFKHLGKVAHNLIEEEYSHENFELHYETQLISPDGDTYDYDFVKENLVEEEVASECQ